MYGIGRSAGRVTIVGLMVGFVAMACQSRGASSSEVVATFGDKSITQAELDERLGSRLLGLKTQEFEMAEAELRSMITDQLVEAEAQRRGISSEALLQSEIDQKIAPVSDADVRAEYERLKPRLGDRSEEQGLRDVRQYLESQRKNQRHAELMGQLMNDAGVVIQLEPPRADVSVDDDPSLGPKGAPVTLVTFSDFQCPYCSRVAPTLHQIHERFGDKVQIVFRDYPLPSHPQAAKAAEASECAHDQGHFWEMHDRLFAHQNQLAVDDLKTHARALGLDGAAFDACLDSGRHASEWEQDRQAGESYGVTATPSSFINGRLLSGAHPLERFAEIIENELARTGGKAATASR